VLVTSTRGQPAVGQVECIQTTPNTLRGDHDQPGCVHAGVRLWYSSGCGVGVRHACGAERQIVVSIIAISAAKAAFLDRSWAFGAVASCLAETFFLAVAYILSWQRLWEGMAGGGPKLSFSPAPGSIGSPGDISESGLVDPWEMNEWEFVREISA